MLMVQHALSCFKMSAASVYVMYCLQCLQLSAQSLDADDVVNLTVYENASVEKRKMYKAF